MATYNFSQNILNNVIRHEETCQIVPTMPVTSDSTLGTDSSILSIPSTTTGNFTYGIPNNFDELAQYTNSTEGYVHTEVKREPCQVSEVTTSAVKGIQQSRSRHAFKTVLNRGVKIETISPKQPEVEEDISQKKTNDPMHPGTDGFKEWSREPVRDPLTNQSQREINYFGIRVADLATAGCGNIYLAGPSFVSAENTAEINPDIHSMNRSSSTFWQYPNSFSFDPVLSMSPIGLQYSRDSSRGQLVFLPTTTPIESFPQASFMWPTYIPQTSGNTLSTSQNLIIPSMTPQTNSQSLSYAPHIQLFGTNYLTTASTTASTAFCQHSQINRFVSLSSDIKRLDQTQKEYEMKTEDSDNEYNSLRKIEKIITSNAPKSKLENKSNCFQSTNAGFECSIPILPNEAQPIMIESSSTSSEFIASPICMPNLTQSTNQNGRIQITHDCASIPYTPEMQDVTIQTDTPVSSEDEILLEVSAVGPDSCREYLEHKRKSVLTDYQTNGNGGILIEKAQSKTIDTFKAGYVNQKEKKTVESEFSTVNKSNKSLDSSCSNKSNSPLNLHCTSLKETIQSVPEMSGLELLSNISTAAFDNHNAVKNVLIKTEPLESPNENILVTETPNRNTEHLNSEATAHVGQNDTQNSLPLSNNQLPLGGLNLLCALAEQRIQEEVQCDNHKETANKVSCDAKRRKCKHAKLKSRKSSYSKKNKRKLAKEIIECLQNTNSKSNNSKLHVNLRNVLKKVDSNYKKLSKWTDPQEFFIAMESDMRMRLADITRQYKKKKRKLDEINKLNKWKKPSSEYKFANISYKNPNFICFLEKCQKTASSIPPFEGMENKMDISAQNNKISGCVIDKYKNNLKSNLTEGRQLKYNTLFTKDRMSHKTQYSENENEKISSENKRKANKTTTSLRQPVITKNSINKNFNDKELILSVEHLYCKETRVLTDMGGLFYAGILKPLQPPDVYSVTLDGERGNKSHIMSREEIFKDTILEVTPKTIEHVPSGTRLCAYWSQQYRCLYPGKAIDSENDDKTSGFVTVEFDDGDSGKIRLENIRLLLSDYPIVEYSKNPFNTLGKYKKTACIKPTSAPKASEGQIYEGLDDAKRRTEIQNKDSNKISNSFNQDFSSAGNIHELNHEHRKHKKKKNKKNNLKSSLKPVSDKEHTKLNECEYNTKQPNFDYRNTNEDYRIDITSQYDSKTNSPIVLHAGCSQPIHSDAIPERSDKSKTREKGDAHNGKGSKIAAFLPERQLWSWLGHAYRRVGIKGRTRKSFYKSITRGKEIITVGECAVFLSTGRPDRPYIGRIEAMWETCSNKVVRVRWFYHPEETTGCPVLKYPGGLFVSPHEDENDVQTISHRCEVIEFSLYIAKFGINNYEQYQSVYDNNDTFYISGYYNPRLQFLKLEPDIPIGNNQP